MCGVTYISIICYRNEKADEPVHTAAEGSNHSRQFAPGQTVHTTADSSHLSRRFTSQQPVHTPADSSHCNRWFTPQQVSLHCACSSHPTCPLALICQMKWWPIVRMERKEGKRVPTIFGAVILWFTCMNLLFSFLMLDVSQFAGFCPSRPPPSCSSPWGASGRFANSTPSHYPFTNSISTTSGFLQVIQGYSVPM